MPEAPPHEQEPNQLGAGVRGPDGTFDEGLADLIVNQVAVEQRNMSTDPLLNAWQDPLGNEDTDECRDEFGLIAGGGSEAEADTEAGTLYNQEIGGGHYYLNDGFNLAALQQRYPAIACMPSLWLVPQFTAPNPVNAGEFVGFDAEESDITLDAGTGYTAGVPHRTYPSYEWNFGDGAKASTPGSPGESPVDQPSVFHAYQYGGTYEVTLTIADTGGNVVTTANEITVDGPPPPSAATGQTGAQTQHGAPATAGSLAVSAAAGPTLRESVLSSSLGKVVRLGLPIKYKVNEQVAGRTEALLEKAVASRLGIKGPLASGLPKGYPRELVIGSAVLVTTRAGQGTVRIKFSKTTAKRLSKARQVKLTLRFVLRNVSSGVVHTATTLSTVVLRR